MTGLADAARRLIGDEARALLSRVERIQPFALQMPMVAAAGLSPAADRAIQQHVANGRSALRRCVLSFIQWLQQGEGRYLPPDAVQRRFAFIRLRFQSLISQIDIFADVVSQRSQHEHGVWVAGLDALAADALAMSGSGLTPPPVVCYLDRGHGAAIRRARTRLPGGDANPVAVIRVPRERMVGSGIGSSLVHEVGHQAASMLDLVGSLRPLLRGLQRTGAHRRAWQLWDRWISEVVADFWSVAYLGITSTIGLIGVVSLPRAFMFRIEADDPHPAPWIRVRLSCAIGNALFPHPQWAALARLWRSLYPTSGLSHDLRTIVGELEATMPGFVTLLVHHRPRMLRGATLRDALAVTSRHPSRLAALFESWRAQPSRMYATRPTLALAAIGQARAGGLLTPEAEGATVSRLLTTWALRRAQSNGSCGAAIRAAA